MNNQNDNSKFDQLFQGLNDQISWSETRKQDQLKRLHRDLDRISHPQRKSHKVKYILSVAVFGLCMFIGSQFSLTQSLFNFNQGGSDGLLIKDEAVDEKKMEELAIIWADTLKTRDGKIRYAILSKRGKQKFLEEQRIATGESYNYIIGNSSPWVVDYEIEIDPAKMTAAITYLTKTSEPAYYNKKEKITFIKMDGKLIVDDYETEYEDILVE